MEFNKHTGYLTKYEVNGQNIIEDGASLTPNFWRAPTDNDFGANIHRKYIAWNKPEIKLTSFKQHTDNKQVIIDAVYELPKVSATLNLTYIINNIGSIKLLKR